MSSFSGFLHRHSLRLPSSIRVALFSARSQFARARTGTGISSHPFLRHYVKPSNILQATAKPTTRSYMVWDPSIRTVLATKKPLLLYKAPDRRLYFVAVYGLAWGLAGAGLYTLKWRYELPEGLPFFVGPTYVVVAIIMFALAFYIFSAPVGRCTSIELIPSTLGRSGVQLRILGRVVPMVRDSVVVANVGEVTIREKTTPVTLELMEAERARRQDVTEGLEGMFVVRRMWEVAARWIDQKWTSFFLRFKFAIFRFGLVKLNIKHGNSVWKIDCSGYMREDGQAIDRIFPQE